MPLPPIYEEPTEELSKFYRSLFEAIAKIPSKVPSATSEIGREIVESLKKPTFSARLETILKSAFFPMEVVSRATEKSVTESLQKRGFREADAKRLGELAGMGAALIFPYGTYGTATKLGRLGKLLTKGREAVLAEDLAKAKRVQEFIKSLTEEKKIIDLEKLPPHLKEIYLEKAPELREKTRRLLEEVYPVKKEIMERHFKPSLAKLAEYMEPGIDIRRYWPEVEREMKTVKENYKEIFKDYLESHVPDFPLLTEYELDLLWEFVKASNLEFGKKLSATRGIVTLLKGDLPYPKDMVYLRVILGDDWANALKAYRAAVRKRKDLSDIQKVLTEVYGVTRAINASYDMSGLLRQALPFVGRKEWRANVPIYVKAFKEENYNKIIAGILSDPFFPLADKFKLGLSEILSGPEEFFISKIAKNIPGIEASERGYTAFLNKLRFDLFKDMTIKAVELGYDPNKDIEVFKNIAQYINIATGKIHMPGSGWLYTGMSFMFFAPKLLVSRLAYPFQIWRLPKGLRNEYFREIATMATAGFGFLSLMKMAYPELIDVDTNPASADFLKVRIGNFRLDPWGGFQQEVVLAYRLATGEAVSSTTGMPFTLGEGYGRSTRMDMIMRYLRNKMHPITGYIYDYLDANRLVIKGDWDWEEAVKSIIPFFINDVWEAFEEDWRLVPLSMLGAFGMGVQTYGTNDHLKPTIRKLGIPSEIVQPVNKELDRLGIQLKMDFDIEVGGAETRISLRDQRLAEMYKKVYVRLVYPGLYNVFKDPEYEKLSDPEKREKLKIALKKIAQDIKKGVLGVPPEFISGQYRLMNAYYYEISRRRGYSEKESRTKARQSAEEYINALVNEINEARRRVHEQIEGRQE